MPSFCINAMDYFMIFLAKTKFQNTQLNLN
jgi:hypothetical protein